LTESESTVGKISFSVAWSKYALYGVLLL